MDIIVEKDQAKLSLRVDMVIDLPEGHTEITEKEKCAIIDRIHHYLTDLGTTSDDYDGVLAGSLTKYGPDFKLLIKEIDEDLK